MHRIALLIVVASFVSSVLGLPVVAQDAVPAKKAKQLPRSTPEAQGVSSSELLRFFEQADTQVDGMHSVMVVRHGHVVAEAWWSPFDAKTPHVLYSLSKSFTSTAVGMAVAEGKLSVDDEVLKFFPEEAPAEPSAHLRSMRVRDLLRMTTGHQTEPSTWRDEPGSPLKGATWTKKFLSHPVIFKPGTLFVYNTPATYMQSAIVQKVSGQTVRDFLGPRLFEPLGIETPTWMMSPEGISAGGFGLSLRTEDLAKFGQLYLQKGQWNGTQLVPVTWVDEATARQTSNGSDPNSDWSQGYGYQFWRSRHESFRGDGAFGQYCIVSPKQDAVVIITSGVRNMQNVLDLVWDKLLPAFKADSLPKDEPAVSQLTSKLASLTMSMPSGKATSPKAGEVNGRWFEFPENDRGIKAVSIDWVSNSPSITVRTADGEVKTPVGVSKWTTSADSFACGMNNFVSVPEKPLIAASGAWTDDNVLAVKLVANETPYYTTLTFRFENGGLLFDGEHNVAFGPTAWPQLIGRPAAAK